MSPNCHPRQVFAHESVLMFVPKPTWPALVLLAKTPAGPPDVARKADDVTARYLQRTVPALGTVAIWELQNGGISVNLRTLAGWLRIRAMSVRAALPHHKTEEPNEMLDGGEEKSIDVSSNTRSSCGTNLTSLYRRAFCMDEGRFDYVPNTPI